MTSLDSRQISYLSVYELVSPLLGDPGLIPGTPTWCQLDDTDPAKWQAILWAALWWCLDQDTLQEATADAAGEISAAANWSAVASWVQRGRGRAYVPRSREGVS
jgi:DNA-binding transcriptional LysR family regulator